MDASEHLPSPKFPDYETVLYGQKPKSTVPILEPIPESEWATRFSAANSDYKSGRPRPANATKCNEAVTEYPPPLSPKSIDLINDSPEFVRTDTVEAQLDPLEHTTYPAFADTSTFEEPFPTFNPSKGQFSFRGWFVAVFATLALVAGFAVGVAGHWKQALSSDAGPPNQLFENRLKVITEELSLLRDDFKDLAARQEQIAQTQEHLSAAQASLATAQGQAAAKWDHLLSGRTNRPRKSRP